MHKTLIAAALLAACPLAAHATDALGYSYAEAGLTRAELDMGDGDTLTANGGYLRGAYALTDATHVFGGFTRVSESDSIYGVKLEGDLDQLELGLGWHMPLTDRIDFTAEAAYVRLDLTIKASYMGSSARDSADLNAGRISLGLRGAPSARTEAWVRAGAMDGADMDSAFVGHLGGQFKFNPAWGLVGEVQWIDEDLLYSAGVRASF